jgi:hypothetical protein
MSKLRLPLFFLILCVPFLELSAQDDTASKGKLDIKTDIQVGMIAGGQILNQEFVYESGVMGQFGVTARLSPAIRLGLGLGLQSLEEETILPFFLDLKAQFKEGENAPFLGLNIGSSTGWSSFYDNLPGYEYEGGFYFSPYYSFQFLVSEEVNVLFSMGYIHQIAEVEYIMEFAEEYEERFSLDFLTLRTGIRF